MTFHRHSWLWPMLASALVATCMAFGPVPICTPDARNDPKCGYFEWGAIGDSWASGVAYSWAVTYDDNKDKCLRINHAYGAQMEQDKSWTKGLQKPHFVACSGSRLRNMYAEHGQIQKTGKPQAIVMTVGGNDVDFVKLASDCIYHPDDLPWSRHDYGPHWEDDPEGVGECKKAIAATREKLNNHEALATWLINTLDDIFQRTDQAKAHNQFYIYVTGYSHYFNVDDDRCDHLTFAPRPVVDKPRLVQGLRKEFNDLLEQFNQVYADAIAAYQPPKGMHVGFIPISSGFTGHRFCEPHHTDPDQWYNYDVYFWNLSNEQLNKVEEAVNIPVITDANGTRHISEVTKYKMLDMISPTWRCSNDVWCGFALRPFHPKEKGHTVIKEAVVKRMKEDKVPGVAI